jgi:hypothetical protein
MKIPDKSKVKKIRYKIQRLHIIDTKKEILNGEPIYIREILDSSSHEYKSSSISALDRLDIIGNLGLEKLTPLMKKCLKSKGYPEREAEKEVFFSLKLILDNAYPKLGVQFVENDSKTMLTLQLLSLSRK